MRQVSDRYQHIATTDLIDMLNFAGFTNVTSDQVKIQRRKNAASVHVARIPVLEPTQLFDSEIQPELVLFNSYQGECSLKARLGFYRAVCANGMTVGTTFQEVSIRHVKGPTFTEKFDQFFSNLDILLADGIQKIEEQTSQALTIERMEQVIKRLEHVAGKRATKLAHQLLQDRPVDQTGNVWQLWNVTNEAMRITARSPVAYEERNARLLDTILKEVA